MSENKNEQIMTLLRELGKKQRRGRFCGKAANMKAPFGEGFDEPQQENAPFFERGDERMFMRHHGGHCHSHRGGFMGNPPMARLRVLAMLSETGELSQRKLSMLLAIRPQTLSEMLAKLEEEGFISRTVNSEDKREMLVCLTEAGKKKAEEFEGMRERFATEFLSPLSEEEKEQLLGLLQKLGVEKQE